MSLYCGYVLRKSTRTEIRGKAPLAENRYTCECDVDMTFLYLDLIRFESVRRLCKCWPLRICETRQTRRPFVCGNAVAGVEMDDIRCGQVRPIWYMLFEGSSPGHHAYHIADICVFYVGCSTILGALRLEFHQVFCPSWNLRLSEDHAFRKHTYHAWVTDQAPLLARIKSALCMMKSIFCSVGIVIIVDEFGIPWSEGLIFPRCFIMNFTPWWTVGIG